MIQIFLKGCLCFLADCIADLMNAPNLQVRVENVPAPETFIDGVLAVVLPEYLSSTYGVPQWVDGEDFLTQLATKSGKLLKVRFFRFVQVGEQRCYIDSKCTLIMLTGASMLCQQNRAK